MRIKVLVILLAMVFIGCTTVPVPTPEKNTRVVQKLQFLNNSSESNNILFEIALGYDFGRIIPRVSFNIGLPLHGVVHFTNGDESLTNTMNTKI